jgi:glucose/arabinose dehydrogenase
MHPRLVARAALVILAVTGCTAEPGPTPTATDTLLTTPPSASTVPDPGVGQLVAVPLTVAEGTSPGSAQGQSLNIPQGWTADVWAKVPNARLAAWTPDGGLLVSSAKTGTIVELTPAGDGKAPTASDLLTGLNGPQGLAFALNGKLLVVGESDKIVAYDYLDGTASNPRTLVDNLPTDGHGAKGVAVNGDTVYYSLGSADNRDPNGRKGNPERATVWQVGLNGKGNSMVATGVRNGFALAIAPDKTLFSAVNQMDNQPYPFKDGSGNYGKVIQDFVNENPVDQVARLTQGTDLGWPFCVMDTRATPTLQDIPYVNDPENNPTGTRLDCSSIPNVMLGLPAHSAPLGLTFTAGTSLEPVLGSGALITVHGSWNRTPPREPGVYFSAWDLATNTLGVPVPLVTGWQSDAGDRWGRSVDAVAGPDGSLYVTDDTAGLVYRITPRE